MRIAGRALPSTMGVLRRHNSTVLKSLTTAFNEHPMKEAARYTKKNDRWTFGKFDTISDDHANALFDMGLRTGDRVAIWLDESAEKHMVTITAAKLGLSVIDFGSEVNTLSDLRQGLALADCHSIYFEPSNATQNKLTLLRKAIPEFFYYDDTMGQEFHSKHFKKLKHFIHTGFDVEMGCLQLQDMFLPQSADALTSTMTPMEMSNNYKAHVKLSDATPFYAKLQRGDSGLKLSNFATHGSIISEKQIPFVNNLASKVYFEVYTLSK